MSNEYLLMRLRYTEGRVVNVSGNQPILLNDANSAWIVFSGVADVFEAELQHGQSIGPRRHLFRAEAGMAMFGIPTNAGLGLMAVGGVEAQIIVVERAALIALVDNIEFSAMVAALIDGWIGLLSAALVESLAPRDFELLQAGKEASLTDGQIAHPRKEVLWVRQLAGQSAYASRRDIPPVESGQTIPLTAVTWLCAIGDAKLLAATTHDVLQQGVVWDDLEWFHRLALDMLKLNANRQQSTERQRFASREQSDAARVARELSELAAILDPGSRTAFDAIDQTDPLLGACQLVGIALGVPIHALPADPHQKRQDRLRDIAQASRIRLRQVILRDYWWAHDNGPLLGTIEDSQQPVALIPTSAQGYELHDPVTRTRVRVSREIAATLGPFAVTFYRPFPDRVLRARTLLQFGLHNSRHDILTILGVGLIMGLLGTLLPISTGIIFDRLIPDAQRNQLWQLAAILLASALATACFQASQGIAVLRLEGKMESRLQAAVFDRLINLPATFFRAYSSGDLGLRALGINTIQQTLSEVAISSIVAVATMLASFVLLFFYSVPLAMAAVAVALLFLAVLLAVSAIRLRHERQLQAVRGNLSGLVLQFVNGIAKLRIAGAEQRAFALWARNFAEQRRLAYRVRRLGSNLTVFNSAFPLVTAVVIYSVLLSSGGATHLSVGEFLAFSAAFAQFSASLLSLGSSLVAVLTIVPTYERATPILTTLPESDSAKAHPGELDGDIELSGVSFRYADSGPLTLDNLSIRIHPGEFVALVGPSGSGKSTLLRLLLGFEKPLSGAVLYSGQDLAELDIRAVRRQMGVVLQNGRLMTGDIFSNIVGASSLTLDDAWAAARMAGFDEDIRQMPMGMQTLVSEGGGTLSGGQRQRLLIARAIATKPRLILFDEATSALDNRTQAVVSASLEALDATRVVIAHRLSTIMNADRILVLDRGRLVQCGSYSELIQQDGLFADLAKRQLAG